MEEQRSSERQATIYQIMQSKIAQGRKIGMAVKNQMSQFNINFKRDI
jgi:hypothetical protein